MNFLPALAGAAASSVADGAKANATDASQGGTPSGKYTQQAAQVAAQSPQMEGQQAPQSRGFMDLLAAANMQGQQDLGRTQQMRGSRYPTQPMNDQNSWWSMYR